VQILNAGLWDISDKFVTDEAAKGFGRGTMIQTQGGSRVKVQVWIFARDERGGYLFLLLKTRPERGLFWQPVTGGVEPAELIEDAALREAHEETGLDFRGIPWSLGHEFSFEAREMKFHEHAFAVEAVAARPVTLDTREHCEFKWVRAEEAMQLVKHASNVEVLKILVRKLGIQAL
jgi:8-oxo-dGTP pyrophosphatase MutT (NUDIX family)